MRSLLKWVQNQNNNMNKLIQNKNILKFILRQNQPFWTKIMYGTRTYIMTFEYNIYEVSRG